MKKIHIVCHMVSTVNGKILSANWGKQSKLYSDLYQECHDSFDSQAWMCGRVTMEKDFTESKEPELLLSPEAIKREPFIANSNSSSFAIAIDASGKLSWDTNDISGDHIIEVLTEQVSDEYLYFLRQKGISYVFAGEKELNFEIALDQLAKHFPIKTIMLEGGGHINGSLLEQGLIDELSLLIVPVADASFETPTTFELSKLSENAAKPLKLQEVSKMEHDVLWLKYSTAKS